MKIANKLLTTSFHPLLFSLYPILFLYSYNINQVFFHETLLSTAIVLTCTSILYLILSFVLDNVKRAAVILTSILIPFFLYGHFNTLGEGMTAPFKLFPMYLLGVVFLYIVYKVIRAKTNFLNITIILNIASIVLVLLTLASIAAFQIRNKTYDPRKIIISSGSEFVKSPVSKTLPDIYYIIFDRYASADSLNEFYNFDNSEFLESLEIRGFYVAYKSRANYLKTAHSLASSLNLEYLNHLQEYIGENSSDWKPLYHMLNDYKVWRFLKKRGYKFVHFGSWWSPTNKNPNADINFKLVTPWSKKMIEGNGVKNVDLSISLKDQITADDLLVEFSSELYKTTLLYALVSGFTDQQYSISANENNSISEVLFTSWHEAIRARILNKFERMAEIPKIKAPTFVFAHMLIPHQPYVFNSDGSYPTTEVVRERGFGKSYIQQIMFVNNKIIELVDTLQRRSKIPPIIIIQSDEGTFPYRYAVNTKNFNWNQATKKELRKKLLILNTYYLPNVDNSLLYPSITPVNTFRLVFNLYFNTNYELLPDRSYVHQDESHLYKFTNINNKLLN